MVSSPVTPRTLIDIQCSPPNSFSLGTAACGFEIAFFVVGSCLVHNRHLKKTIYQKQMEIMWLDYNVLHKSYIYRRNEVERHHILSLSMHAHTN